MTSLYHYQEVTLDDISFHKIVDASNKDSENSKNGLLITMAMKPLATKV